MAFFLTRKAKTDLKDIARYTQKEWGIRQRDIYLSIIDRAFRLLSDFPEKGQSCDYIRNGYLKYYVGKHIVFYCIVSPSEDIEIVRILHQSMDIRRQFY